MSILRRITNKYATLSILFSLSLTQVNSKELTAVTELLGNLQFKNEQGELDGYSIEIANMLAERVGYKLNIVSLPWARAYRLAQEKENTLIFSIARTPSRESQFNWVGSLCKVPLYVWSTNDHPIDKLTSEDELLQYSFVVTNNSRIEKFLIEQEVLNIVSVSNEDQVSEMLLRGRVDFSISGDRIMQNRVSKQGLDPTLFKKVYRLNGIEHNLSMAFGMKTDSHLLQAFQDAFKELENENILVDLRKRWSISCD